MLRAALSTPRGASTRALLFLLIFLLPACDDGDSLTAPVPSVPAVAGRVISSATGDPVVGAEVSLGAASATTGPDGRFELTELTTGPATLRCVATGFEDFEAEITVPSGILTRDIMLTPVDPLAPLLIGAVLTSQFQSIAVFRAGEGINDAIVTVNGFAIPHVVSPERGLLRGWYERGLPEAVPAGSPLHLKVIARGLTVEATGTMPEAPVLTAPAQGAVFALADSITITWTSPTDPHGFEGFIATGDAFCCEILGPFPGTARELKIAASALPVGNPSIVLFARNEGSFTGPADPDSRMVIESIGVAIGFTITP